MTIQDYINRGYNLLATTIVALAGFAFLSEVFLENDLPDKIDDTLLFVLAMVSIYWYNHAKNRFTRSILPPVLLSLALLVKLAGLYIEFDDAASAGDDFGGLILFVIATGLIWYQYNKTAKLLAAPSA